MLDRRWRRHRAWHRVLMVTAWGAIIVAIFVLILSSVWTTLKVLQ